MDAATEAGGEKCWEMESLETSETVFSPSPFNLEID